METDDRMIHYDPSNYSGLHHVAEMRALASYAGRVASSEAIVEIGSYTGVSALWLAYAARNVRGARVTCIDPWPEPRPDEQDLEHAARQRRALSVFQQHMYETGWPVTALRARAADVLPMWIQPIGMLFIDGDHSLAAVLSDLEWVQHIVPGGILALHDYFDAAGSPTDVAEALQIKGLDRHRFAHLETVETTWIGRAR